MARLPISSFRASRTFRQSPARVARECCDHAAAAKQRKKSFSAPSSLVGLNKISHPRCLFNRRSVEKESGLLCSEQTYRLNAIRCCSSSAGRQQQQQQQQRQRQQCRVPSRETGGKLHPQSTAGSVVGIRSVCAHSGVVPHSQQPVESALAVTRLLEGTSFFSTAASVGLTEQEDIIPMESRYPGPEKPSEQLGSLVPQLETASIQDDKGWTGDRDLPRTGGLAREEIYVNPICMELDALICRAESAEEVLSCLVSHRGKLSFE